MPKYGHNRTTRNRTAWQVKESKLVANPSTFERVDFDPVKFDTFLNQKGVRARVYRTLYCPKVKSVDGAEHEIDCELCNGSGFYDVDPICTLAVVQNQELEALPNVEGFVDGNTVQITFPIGIELQYFTLIELEDFTDLYKQRVMRAPGTSVDVLKYHACRVNVLIDYSGRRYYQDQDFMVDPDGNVRWLTPGDQKLVAFSAVPASGDFTLTWGGNTTAAVPFNATAGQVQTALRTLVGLEDVTVAGDFTDGFTVTFVGVDSPVSALTSASNLLDGGAVAVTITVSDASVAADKPNDGVAYSIHYEAAVQFRAKMASKVNRFTQYLVDGQAEHIKLPEQWYCTKEFLVRRRNLDGDDTEQGPWSEHSVTDDNQG